MPKISLDYDLENVSSTFEPLPPDNYHARLDEPPEFKESSTGKPMLVFQWIIADGEHEGRKLYDNVVTTVTWKVKQYCQLAGIESGSELDTNDFTGLEAILTVATEPRQDKPDEERNVIKAMNPVG